MGDINKWGTFVIRGPFKVHGKSFSSGIRKEGLWQKYVKRITGTNLYVGIPDFSLQIFNPAAMEL